MTTPDAGTHPAEGRWPDSDAAFLRWERTAVLGLGEAVWLQAGDAVMRWAVKTRSGFSVEPAGSVAVGDRPIIRATMLGVTVHEPVEVVAVVDTADRVGFAYRTLAGHPVRGEEAFIVHRDGEVVQLSIRSLTAPGDTKRWRSVYPLLLVAQQVVRRRYLRALTSPTR